MARAMWRGAIQFGLVTIPVKLYLATESRGGLSFNLLHETCLNRIQMKTHCPEHGEIPRSETVRGFEYAKGHYVVIEESDFENVPLKTVRSIEIEQFVDAERGEYGQTFIKQAYYIEPEPVGRKAFYLLKAVLGETGLQAICKIVLKDREMLAALNPYEQTMLLNTLYWPDEVRDLGDLELPSDDFDFKPAEMQMARSLVQAMTGDFDADQYHDEYREALMRVIEAKVDGQPVAEREPEPQPTGKLTDLMAVLEASVAAARQGRGGAAASDAEKDKPAARRASSGRASRAKAEEPTSVEEARKSRAARGGSRAASTSGAKSTSKSGSKTAAKPAARAAASERTERKRKSA